LNGHTENPRTKFNTPIDELQKEFLNDDFKDDYREFFTGKVVNNKDPEKLGRCRIRVYNLFDISIPDSDLPWAIPDMSFVGSKVGSFIVPPVDALVNVYFDRGDIYCPRYTTKVVDKSNLPKERLKNYPNNMVFYESDNGDFFTVDRLTGVTKFKHRSGTSIKINIDGSLDINARVISIKGSEESPIGGGFVAPSSGPFCSLPVCLLTGAPHTGFKAINT
jgi:hypothetical protein